MSTTSHARLNSEWVYSTKLSRRLRLTTLNKYIHSIPFVSYQAEIFIFACGYAFNPVMFPMWILLVHRLSCSWNAENEAAVRLFSNNSGHYPIMNTVFYILTALTTLAFTELGKVSFATTRPQSPITARSTSSDKNQRDVAKNNVPIRTCKRRFGVLVSSLKSKHSFPSGDCAQAMNLCLFLYRYVPSTPIIMYSFNGSTILNIISFRDMLLFGVLLPGVAFARVFYWCHWIEDCIGGVLLTSLIHLTLIPTDQIEAWKLVSF